MLIGVIHKPTLADLAATVRDLDKSPYDALELRLDGCLDLTSSGSMAEWADLLALARPLPVILTLRARAEGGSFDGSEEDRLALLEKLATLEPAYLDLEAAIPAPRLARLRALCPRTRIILSWHDFTGSPPCLDTVLERMQAQLAGPVIYKLSALAHHCLDALRMLVFCKEKSKQGLELTGISMGEAGSSTRILAPVVHVDAATAALLEGVDFADLCITSDIAVVTVPAPEGAFALAEVEGVAVVFRAAEGAKCERCWQVLPDVGTHSHAGVCARCDEALG